jgi:hypothetical protein
VNDMDDLMDHWTATIAPPLRKKEEAVWSTRGLSLDRSVVP